MEVTLQSSILIVADLRRSIEFYASVFGFPLLGERDQAAVLKVAQAERPQVLMLRESPNRHARHPGRGSIGIRVIGFETTSIEELDEIQRRLTERNAFVGRRRSKEWEAVIGVDPDQCEVAVSSGVAGHPLQLSHWASLDDMVEAIAQ